MNNRGIALITSYLVIAVLLGLTASISSRAVSEGRSAQSLKESAQAFGLAEAAVDRALYELKQNFSWISGVSNQSLGQGTYSVSVTQIDSAGSKIIATGYLPDSTSPRATRSIEAYIRKDPSLNTTNAIYTADRLDLYGEAYSIVGNVIYADRIDEHGHTPLNITGGTQVPNPMRDPSISPLTALNFQSLRDKAVSQVQSDGQNNLWTAARTQTGFPTQFCYSGSIANGDCVPNVIYMETDLELRGNIGTIAGFFVVVGDVLTNPTGHFDAEIRGNGRVEGAIYTTGEFEIRGGGERLNVNGGVWSGRGAELRGDSTVSHNSDYMDVLNNIITPTPQIVGWREI